MILHINIMNIKLKLRWKLSCKIYVVDFAFYHLQPMYTVGHVIMTGAQLEIMSKCLNLSWMERYNLNSFCI